MIVFYLTLEYWSKNTLEGFCGDFFCQFWFTYLLKGCSEKAAFAIPSQD